MGLLAIRVGVLLLSACTFSPRAANDAAVTPEAIDAPIDCTTWMPHHFVPCDIGAPSGALELTDTAGYTYDTTVNRLVITGTDVPIVHTIAMVDQGGTPALIMNVTRLTIAPQVTLRVIGDKPLIVAAWETIDLGGVIDTTSTAGSPGAGSNPSACATGGATVGVDDDIDGGSGGGGGGAFHGNGGGGGPGDAGAQNPGGGGGIAVTAVPAIVRGGCSGATSGRAGNDPSVTTPSDANTVSPAGAGGGAIQLTAQTMISIGTDGRILAGGGGGAGAPLHSAVGGGGGGAGGYIGLEAPAIAITGTPVLAANGGGGGGSSGFSGTGTAGMDGQPSAVPATGGPASTCSNPGGVGGAGDVLDGVGALQTGQDCGGGGGGGAAGFILVFAPALDTGTAVVSPDAQLNPF